MLLLFDIDGTLVQRASREHAVALRQALHNVHGIDPDAIGPSKDRAGRTDGEIARMILLDAGVSADAIDSRAEEVQDECCRLYATLCPPDLSATVVPGMPDLLSWLADVSGAQLALVTGNFEAVARIKLRAAGIGHWFEPGQGGFGSDSEDRLALPPLARRRAGEAAGLTTSWPREQTLVIGDTPRDIACARSDGLRCVAVTSGPHGELALVDADAIARSSAELRAVLEALLGF
jgi:phosphoglycolate phosphatase